MGFGDFWGEKPREQKEATGFWNFWEDKPKEEKKETLIDKMQNLDPKTAQNIRVGLNVATFILTMGLFHLCYYAFTFFNWFVGVCTGVRAAETLERDPFKNISYLNPEKNAGMPVYYF